jgi:hypothetical protein
MTDHTTPGDVLQTLDDVRQVLVDQRPDDDFYETAQRFVAAFRSQMAQRRVEAWDELHQLLAFEAAIIADPDLDDDLFAAAKTVRDWITSGRHKQASLN